MDAAVVELDALADPVGATAEHHDLLAAGGLGLALLFIGGVHVGSARGELGGTGVDTLVDRADIELVAACAHLALGHAQKRRETRVGKALALEPEQLVGIEVVQRALGHLAFQTHQLLELDQEPAVDIGQREHLVHAHAAAHGVGDVEDAVGAGGLQLALDQRHVLGAEVGDLGIEPVDTDLQAAQRFLHRLLEGAADRHHLTHRLHLGGQAVVGLGELLEGKTRNLGDHVIDRGLEGGRSGAAGDVVLQFVEGVTHRQLGGDLGDREAGGLGRQRRGARHPRVHLDHHHAPGIRIDAELHIGAAGLDADLAQHRKRCVTHDLVLLVGQRLRRRYGDGVAGVHAHGVEVLDRADDDAIVVLVTNDLHLVLLPPQQGFVDQQLVVVGELEPATADLLELLLVVGHAAAGAAHGVGGTDDHREAQLALNLPRLVHGVSDLGLGALQADVLHRLVEQIAIFGLVDGIGVGTDHLHAVLGQHAVLVQVQRTVERGLPAHGRQNRRGALALDDLLHRLPGDRLDIGGVGHHRVGHDGGRVGVDQDDAVALFAQRLTGLGPGVVEFARLPDDDGAGADDQNAVEIRTFWHALTLVE